MTDYPTPEHKCDVCKESTMAPIETWFVEDNITGCCQYASPPFPFIKYFGDTFSFKNFEHSSVKVCEACIKNNGIILTPIEDRCQCELCHQYFHSVWCDDLDIAGDACDVQLTYDGLYGGYYSHFDPPSRIGWKSRDVIPEKVKLLLDKQDPTKRSGLISLDGYKSSILCCDNCITELVKEDLFDDPDNLLPPVK